MAEIEERRAVVAAAMSWRGTPYSHMGRVKGVGVDCATLLAEVFHEAGLVEAVDIPFYPRDWHLHRDTERYLNIVRRYAREIVGPPGPGDIAVWRFGRCYSHGAIVIDWPIVIHAYVGMACTTEDAQAAAWLNTVSEMRAARGEARPRLFFSPWAP